MNSPLAKQGIVCGTCGGSILSNAPFGLCPRCLLSLGETEFNRDEAGAAADFSLEPASKEFDYQLLDRIGRGGMGVVYRARQRSLNRIVAVKMIAMGDSASPSELARFCREAELAAKLDHPNIVSIIEVGEIDATPFLVMRFVEGACLSARLGEFALRAEARGNEAREAQVKIAKLIATVARAVDFAHSKGILHRDLKPSNILLDAEDRPHLTDFGIAKSLEQETSLTQTAELLGTLCYMSPEQASGKVTSRESDVYSLGAILYELLTRRRPFEGPRMEVLKSVLEKEPAPPRHLNPAIARDLATICLKCLDKNPVRRYNTALALAEDLERWLRQEPILAREAGVVIRSQRWVARNRAVAALLVTLSTGIVISLILLARANEAKSRKSIALDILRSESARQLQEIWNATNAFVDIKSETLSAMAGMEPSSLRENEKRFGIALVSEGNPLARVLRAAPMLERIETSMSEIVETPARFDLRLYKDPARAIEDLAQGNVDFAQLNAWQFVRAREGNPKLKALLRIGEQDGAVIFARKNSGIKSLSDLRGKSILLGPADSTMTFWTKAALVHAGVSGSALGQVRYPDRARDGYSRMSAVEAVAAGLVDAAVVRESRFNEVPKQQGLVALHRFNDSGELIVARADLPLETSAAFRRVILGSDAETAEPLLLSGAAKLRTAKEDDFVEIAQNIGAESAFEQ